MKKLLIIIFLTAGICSCKTLPVGTQVGQPEFSFDGKKLCLKQTAQATINQDSLIYLLSKGIKIGNDTNFIFINYSNGALKAEGAGCLMIKK